MTSDRFGAQPVNRDVEGNLEGRFVVLKGPDKQGAPDLVAGGEVIFPIDTNQHATELAVYVGPDFQFSHGLSGGLYGQVRKILVPPSEVNGVIFNRSNMELFEIPVFAQYKFGPARRAFVQAQISPEFSPRFKNTSKQGPSPLPNPDLDHGYAIKGVVGYNFGKWYAKATYSTRYFKFRPGISNPSDLYNWRTDVITGGVGFVF